jgi:hypothetical protein
LIRLRREERAMQSEITFSMDATSSAPHVVGAWVVPQAARYSAQWVDRGDRTYLTLRVESSVVEDMVKKVCAMHRSVRCIRRDPVIVPAV